MSWPDIPGRRAQRPAQKPKPPDGPRIEASRCPRLPGYPGSEPGTRLLCWRPLPAPRFGPRGDEVRHDAREADRSTPSGVLKKTVSRLAGAGLPCRVVCLPAAQSSHETRSRGEACALPDNSCLTACLTRHRRPERITGRNTGPDSPAPTPPHTGGLPPLPRWSEAITRGSTGVEAPRYPPGDTPRRQERGAPTSTPDTDHSNGCKFVLFHSRKPIVQPPLLRPPGGDVPTPRP
jgi:hypothetical protein